MLPRQLLEPLLPFALILGLSGATFGQAGALHERLAKAASLSCTFSALAVGTWTNGTAGAETTRATLLVKYVAINVDEGTADAEGQFVGASSVVVRYVNGYLHLMQTHRAGPLYTTTVLAKETKGGRLMAVHTRHEYSDVRLPGFTSSPEMYLGDCAPGT